MIFKRKMYNRLLAWKRQAAGTKALLIEGARRIGKSTLVEEFAKNEYQSYLLIDFNKVSDSVISAFNNYMNDLDTFFLILSSEYGVKLYPKESIIIFDEIQQFPKARQAIKYLVADGRFDYIETGSLISIKENVKDITIPSEERTQLMYPMDFEEFAWAMNEEPLITYIRQCFDKKVSLEQGLHAKAMLLFRQYMIVGGMPKSLSAYLENNRSFEMADMEKRDILTLYRNDIMKIKSGYRSSVLSIFDQIPAFLSRSERRVVMNRIEKGASFPKYHDTFFWLSDSMIANECFNCSDPNVGLSLNEDRTYVKCYMGDTGLLISHTFDENEISDGELYREILLGKLSVNEGMFYENVIAQMLVAAGHKLYFYTRYNEEKHRNDMEIDFILSNHSKLKYKIFPIEVKSNDKYTIRSLIRFNESFHQRIGECYVIHPKNLCVKEGIVYLPAYMTFCL
ncbi:ATP-binding protein [Bacteroides finegoldii]|jgi:predicted AAA+ superfamily ATPase|uniref:ATP-binding protein n=1 Tax=Bacteroides finegoldii TaxID=338188 RepID=UPI0022E6471B|nr:AAA family ATPase [Bacteroides finegoldii]